MFCPSKKSRKLKSGLKPKGHGELLQRDGVREIGHGNTVSFSHDTVEILHFGKTVKSMARLEFVDEYPLLAYLLGREAEKSFSEMA